MEILLIMLVGVGAGRFFPAKYKEKNEKVQLFCTLLLIFSMGVSLGRREGFFAELGTLGVQSFLFFLIPAVFSVAAVYLLTRRFMGGKQREDGGRAAGNRQGKGDPMVFLALGALLLGTGSNVVPALADFFKPLASHSDWILWVLMFSVGISVGLHRGLLSRLCQYHVKILVIPLGIILGSLAGGVLCGLLLQYPLNEHRLSEQSLAGNRLLFYDPLHRPLPERLHLHRPGGSHQRGHHPSHADPLYE